MLNPNNDRLDYGQLLSPPAGYYLDFAVGTTYSLDLDALVGASLALGLSEETDSVLMNNPVCLLEALRSTGDKVALFCEGGQIGIPGKVTPLYILLEKMVFPVKTMRRKTIAAYPSFHPKFWLIRYKKSEKELLYRVVVLSRNLTFDRSWDITFYMDGHNTKKESKKAMQQNEPICDFLRYLLTQLPSDENGKEKAKEIRLLIKELSEVVFEPAEKEFYDFEFIPNGIRNSRGEYYSFDQTELFNETFHEIMIMSPFLSGGIIRNFNDRNIKSPIQDAKYMLITREMSLEKLKPEDVSNFSIYTMRDSVIDGEMAISDENENAQKQDIHAKVYMMRKYSTSSLYLGSLNASHNAVYGNIEFMIKLTAKNRYLNLEKLKASLFCGDENNPDNPFQLTPLGKAIIDKAGDKSDILNSVIKDINRCNPLAEVSKESEEYYSIRVYFDEYDLKDFKVTLRPLLSNRTVEFGKEMMFDKLTVTQLSEFYVLSVSDGETSLERVIVIQTKGLPDDREKAVVSSVVSNRECFYRYIAFLLGDDSILSALESSILGSNALSKQNKQAYNLPALYEKMLQTAAVAPEKFKGIEYLIKTISEDGIIPESFKKLYETFRKVVKLDG